MSILSTVISLKSAEEKEWRELYDYIIKLEKENDKHKNWVDILNKENHKLESKIDQVREYVRKWQEYPHTNCSTHNELKNIMEILNEEKIIYGDKLKVEWYGESILDKGE